MDTKIKKIIFVGGLDNRTGDLNIEEQTKLVIEGYGDNVTSFRYNTSITQIKAEIENNIGSPIMLFSAGCQFSKQIADFLITLGQKLDILHVVEPFTCSENTKTTVESAIKIGLPSSNVFKGPTDCTGANINGATSNEKLGRTSHWDALKVVGSFIKSNFEEKVEEVKNTEKKELKTYELILKIDQDGDITNDKLGYLKIINKIADSLLTGFNFGEDEQDLSLLDDEFIEEDFAGKDENGTVFLKETGQKPDGVSRETELQSDLDDLDDLNKPVIIPVPKEGDLTISQSGLIQLIKHEGSRATIYDDKTGKSISSYGVVQGFPTIGVGHLIKESEKEKFKKYLNPGKMSENEIKNLLIADLSERIKNLNKSLKVKVKQGQFDALLSMMFNTGSGNSSYKKALELTNEGKKESAARQIESGPKTSKGVILKGLEKRRKDEASWYLRNDL
jgi:lysozyme